MADWKRMYTDVSRMLDKYQNDVVPGLRKQLENRVEVVRCKDCKMFCRNYAHLRKHCGLTGAIVEDDDFCSYGERKDNERKAD